MSGVPMRTKLSRSKRQRSHLRALLLLIALLIALSSTQPSFAHKKGKPLTREEIAQVWFGWSTDELYFLRLELHPNGKGQGGFIFRGEKPQVFRIDSWKYEQGGLEIIPISSPEGTSTWVRPLRGSMVGLVMKLTAKGRDWNLSFLLRRETEFEAGWQALKQQMTQK